MGLLGGDIPKCINCDRKMSWVAKCYFNDYEDFGNYKCQNAKCASSPYKVIDKEKKR